MGVLKTITDEYFGDSIREEDKIDISGLDVEIVSFKDNNGNFHGHGYKVKRRSVLQSLIKRIIEKRGNECDLNDIDVSEMDDFGDIFYYSHFNGDISGWDVSNVKYMHDMFEGSDFNGDLSKWNVLNVESMVYMFKNSKFDSRNGDISNWKVNKDCKTTGMFNGTSLCYNPPKWKKNSFN